MPANYYVAQMNIARMRAPLEDPIMEGFRVRLADINALADGSPGFVWRLQTDSGDATSIRPFDDNRIIVNFSVWETPEQWHAFVFRSAHVDVMRQRSAWFERFDEAYSVMWWIPAGTIPTVSEGKQRLEHLRQHGDSPYAFCYARRFPPPEE